MRERHEINVEMPHQKRNHPPGRWDSITVVVPPTTIPTAMSSTHTSKLPKVEEKDGKTKETAQNHKLYWGQKTIPSICSTIWPARSACANPSTISYPYSHRTIGGGSWRLGLFINVSDLVNPTDPSRPAIMWSISLHTSVRYGCK